MKRIIKCGSATNYKRDFEGTQKLSAIKNCNTKLLEILDCLEQIEDSNLGRGSAIVNKVKGHIFDSYELLEEAERLYKTVYDL